MGAARRVPARSERPDEFNPSRATRAWQSGQGPERLRRW
jgi:hypothetical protein